MENNKPPKISLDNRRNNQKKADSLEENFDVPISFDNNRESSNELEKKTFLGTKTNGRNRNNQKRRKLPLLLIITIFSLVLFSFSIIYFLINNSSTKNKSISLRSELIEELENYVEKTSNEDFVFNEDEYSLYLKKAEYVPNNIPVDLIMKIKQVKPIDKNDGKLERRIHKIKKNENLYRIAEMYETTPNKIINDNQGVTEKNLNIGDELVIYVAKGYEQKKINIPTSNPKKSNTKNKSYNNKDRKDENSDLINLTDNNEDAIVSGDYEIMINDSYDANAIEKADSFLRKIKRNKYIYSANKMYEHVENLTALIKRDSNEEAEMLKYNLMKIEETFFPSGLKKDHYEKVEIAAGQYNSLNERATTLMKNYNFSYDEMIDIFIKYNPELRDFEDNEPLIGIEKIIIYILCFGNLILRKKHLDMRC